MNKMNRRMLLKYAGTGMAAGVLSSSIGKAMASTLPGNHYTPKVQNWDWKD